MLTRNSVVRCSLACAAVFAQTAIAADTSRPNILWLVVDDIGCELPLFGEKTIATPNIDRLASEGVLFTNAIVTAPVCSSSRSALITGMYQTSIGAQNHQSGRGEHRIPLPEGVEPVPAMFQRHDYFTSNADYPPGRTKAGLGKTDYNFDWDPAIYTGTDWSERQPDRPFFAQLQLWGGKYRDNPEWKFDGKPTEPESVTLPPYYPRDPVLLRDRARYLDCLRVTDQEVGKIVARLEKEGLLERTVIFFLGDNGISHARGKQFLYDEGIRTPLIVRGPGIPRGVVRDDPVEHIDIAAASLALAGIPVPRWMQARDMFAAGYQPRDAVFAARDRCGETVDRIRAVRTRDFKYIRNGFPDRPHLQPNNYKDSKGILKRLRELHEAGKLDPLQERILFSPTRDAEELYDLRTDPHETRNLATAPEQAAVLSDIRQRLDRWQIETNDPPPESAEVYELEMRYQTGKMRKDPDGKQEVERNIELMKKWAAAEKSAPRLLSPANGGDGVSPFPAFEWSQVTQPKPAAMPSYEIQIAAAADFSRLVDTDTLPAVICWYVPDQPLPPGKYWWRVATIEPGGSRGGWSRPGAFSVSEPQRVFSIAAGADFAGIRKTIAEAAANTPAVVRFEKGDYRLDPGGEKVFIDLGGTEDLIIDGGGSRLTFGGFLRFVNMENCRRVVIRDITFDFDPLPYTAGKVTAVDPGKKTFDIELIEGHLPPESDAHFETDTSAMLMEGDLPRLKRGSSLTVRHGGWEKLGAGQYRFRLARPEQIKEVATGDAYVLGPRFKGCIGFTIYGGSDIVFFRLFAHAVANEAFESFYSNRHALLHCGLLRQPGRFLAANNGGHNHHSNRLGPWIEGGTWDNAGDDTVHISALPSAVREVVSPRIVRIASSNPHDHYGGRIGLDIVPGDRLQFFDGPKGLLLGEGPVVSAKVSGKHVEVVLGGDIGPLKPGKLGDRASTRVFNAGRMCNQFVFRHNMVENGRRVGVIAKGTGGWIEDNTFEGLGGGGIEFWNSPSGGLAAENHVVRGNRIADSSRMINAHPAIHSTIYQTGASRLHRNLLIENNTIESFATPAILLRDTESALVRANRITIRNPGDDEPVATSNAGCVEISGNIIQGAKE